MKLRQFALTALAVANAWACSAPESASVNDHVSNQGNGAITADDTSTDGGMATDGTSDSCTPGQDCSTTCPAWCPCTSCSPSFCHKDCPTNCCTQPTQAPFALALVERTVPGKTTMTDPATGQTMAVPGWVDVTAEVYAAVPAGVTLVPDSMFALYTNQEEILCPDDIPERGLHCAWRKEANNNLPAAGITYMYACGTEGPRFLLQNGGENTAIVTADFVQEGVKQKVDGSLGQWPIRCPFGEVKLPPGTVQPDGNINPSVLTITNEFDNCAGAATDQKTIFAHYGNKPIYYPSGTKCPDGSPAPSPAGICYGCSLEKPPPLMGLSVIPAVCGNVGGKMVCNMMLEWVTRYVEGVVTW